MQNLLFTDRLRMDEYQAGMVRHLLVQVNNLDAVVKSSFDYLHTDYEWRLTEAADILAKSMLKIDKLEEENAELRTELDQLKQDMTQLKLHDGIMKLLNSQRVLEQSTC